MRKGIIVPARIVIDRPRSIIMDAGVDSAELRRLLLYWDEIVCLAANGVGSRFLPKAETIELIDAGVLRDYHVFVDEARLSAAGIPTALEIPQQGLGLFQVGGNMVTTSTGVPEIDAGIAQQCDVARTRGEFGDVAICGFIPEQIRAAHDIGLGVALSNLTSAERSTDWSILHDFQSRELASESSRARHAVELALVNALPVPDKDAQVLDLLRFKDKHRPELMRLRAVIASFCTRVSTSNDAEAELSSVMAELDAALAEIARCLDRSCIRRIAGSLRSLVQIEPAPLLTAIAAAKVFNLDGVMPALAAVGLTAALKLAKRPVQLPAPIADRYGDFAYIYEYQRKLR